MKSINEYRDIFLEQLEKQDFAVEPKELSDPIVYTLALSGKRIRPVLAMMSCEMFGGKWQDCIDQAIGLEVFHNFTLLHDDIMDKSPIRRGKPTVYKKWDSNIAILSGDTMFCMAYQYIVKTDKEILPAIVEIFNQTAVEVCRGQQYDMNFETQNNVSIPEYLEMIRLKTAVFIGACLKTGATIARADKDDIQNAYDFGESIGMAFQIQDDLLDLYGDEEVFGKRIGNDVMTNKKTYLYLKALELGNEEDKKTLMDLFSGLQTTDDKAKVKKIIDIYHRLEVKKATLKEMENYYQKALTFLENIHVHESLKKELYAFSEKLKSRKS